MQLFARFSLAGIFCVAALILQPGIATAQSRDEAHPTPISAFPVNGTLASGTYYYEIPEAAVLGGSATAVLDLTPPDGGGSMTVTFSGRRCCPPEAYLGATTGLSDRMREATTFDIPGAQNLLVTVYVSVATKHTVRFRLNLTFGPVTSGIVITPPPPAPTTPSGPLCTDLGVDSFAVDGAALTRHISGSVRNLTTTHRYKGYGRRQWLEIRDITDSETRPVVVTRSGLPAIIEPGASVSYSVIHRLTERRRTRYEVRIVYSHLNATDESPYNDDCNSSNNSTRRQLIGPFPSDPLPERP